MNKWIDRKTHKVVDNIDDMPEGVFGFIYLIVTAEGKSYIGKKQVASRRKRRFGKKEAAKITDKRKKHWEWVVKESNWKEYVSSNKELCEDISNGIKYEKFILEYAFSKKELSYKEEKYLFVNEVLEQGDTYYNGNIRGVYFKGKLV